MRKKGYSEEKKRTLNVGVIWKLETVKEWIIGKRPGIWLASSPNTSTKVHFKFINKTQLRKKDRRELMKVLPPKEKNNSISSLDEVPLQQKKRMIIKRD